MGIVVQENELNKGMHNPPYTTGVVVAPDSHYKPVLYSHYQATKEFNQIDRDIYEARSKQKSADRKKTPKSVIVACILAGTFVIFKLVKHLIKK